MLMGIIQFTGNAKERKDKLPVAKRRLDPVQKGGAGHRWMKGQLPPITEEVKKIWVQMGLGMSVWLWAGKVPLCLIPL